MDAAFNIRWCVCPLVAWSGEVPFGELPGADGIDRPIFGFAVCRYDTKQYCRFTCNKHWEVVQDMDSVDEAEAKQDIPNQYDASRVIWQRYIGEEKSDEPRTKRSGESGSGDCPG